MPTSMAMIAIIVHAIMCTTKHLAASCVCYKVHLVQMVTGMARKQLMCR